MRLLIRIDSFSALLFRKGTNVGSLLNEIHKGQMVEEKNRYTNEAKFVPVASRIELDLLDDADPRLPGEHQTDTHILQMLCDGQAQKIIELEEEIKSLRKTLGVEVAPKLGITDDDGAGPF